MNESKKLAMTIYVVSVDSERGRYLAFDKDNPDCKAESSYSAAEAIGQLVLNGSVEGLSARVIE